jgi:hypothetical protein
MSGAHAHDEMKSERVEDVHRETRRIRQDLGTILPAIRQRLEIASEYETHNCRRTQILFYADVNGSISVVMLPTVHWTIVREVFQHYVFVNSESYNGLVARMEY